jgi:hypothetical protein
VSRTFVVLSCTVVFTLSGGPSALTFTGSGPGGDGSGQIGGDALTRASESALAATGGGRVTGHEFGDEESFCEVHVTLVDGRQVDVRLDESFAVVSRSGEERPEDRPAGG